MLLLLEGILKANTAFMIGQGTDEGSDSDVLRNADQELFIPGTTLAGICRHFLEKQFSGDNTVDINKIFGSKQQGRQEDISESEIIFCDAFEYRGENYKSALTSVRDSVRLNYKVAVDKSKFDYEVVEAGAKFVFRLEWLTEEVDIAKKIIQSLITGFNKGDIRIGAKTTRGFGAFVLDDVCYKELNLNKSDDMKKYIDKEFELTEWKDIDNMAEYKSSYETINTKLVLESFLFIRNYATLEKVHQEDGKGKFVDAETIRDSEGNPIIPGTAWAGVFRHHCKEVLERVKYESQAKREDLLNTMFGYQTAPDNEGGTPKTDKKTMSNIIFKEVKIDKESVVILNRTRSAIDRFSGSALQTGALFTERIACKKDGYKTEIDVEIKIKKNIDKFKLIKSLIDICIKDLQEGVLTVGGNTSIGAGIFSSQNKEGADGRV